MFVVEASATLWHPPEPVFAAVASLEGAVRWQGGVCGVRRAPRGGSRLGALVLLYRALGVRHALVARVTAVEAPRRFAYRAVGDAFVIDTALDVEPVEAGAGAGVGARVRYRLTLDSAAPAAELRRLLARRAGRDLARLAAWVEARERVRGGRGATSGVSTD